MCEIYVHIMDVCIMRNYQRLKGCIRSAQKQRLEIIVFRCSAVSKALCTVVNKSMELDLEQYRLL